MNRLLPLADGLSLTKIIKQALAGVALSLAFAGPAMAQFADGNRLIEWIDASDRVRQGSTNADDLNNSAILIGYTMALVDQPQSPFCMTGDAPVSQLIAIIAKYVRARPELWNRNASWLVNFALLGAFPCSK